MNKIVGKRILITGGTGSLGSALVGRLLLGLNGNPDKVVVYSRDELKQSELKAKWHDDRLHFIIGDVRDRQCVELALQDIDIVFNAAAMKRVETCQRFPAEAIKTNCLGTINIVEAIQSRRTSVETVVGVSSDKGCSPVNNYGATKFLQEKILLAANEDCPNTRFVSVCYGNVMGSRGSVIPIFQELVKANKALTVHDPNMTRFLISLEQAVDTLMAALENAKRGEVYVPIIPSATVADIADVLIGDRDIERKVVGKGPGEKLHEILINEADVDQVIMRDGYYVVTSDIQKEPALTQEYNSKDYLLNKGELAALFSKLRLIV